LNIRWDRLVNVQRMGGMVKASCPACLEECGGTNDHLAIFPDGSFGCAKYQGGAGSEHYRRIYQLLYSEDDSNSEFFEPSPKIKIEKVFSESLLSRLLPDRSYWLNRGVSEATLKTFEGGIAPKGERGKLAGRYVFPLRGLDGQIAGFAGRLIEENRFAPKWKILGAKKNIVYPLNISKLHIIKCRSAVLVESIGDALTCYDHGICNILVLFGLNVHSRLIAELIALDLKRLIISTNNDASKIGNQAATKIKKKLDLFWP
jgi:hypothetical protein